MVRKTRDVVTVEISPNLIDVSDWRQTEKLNKPTIKDNLEPYTRIFCIVDQITELVNDNAFLEGFAVTQVCRELNMAKHMRRGRAHALQ